MFEMDLPPEKRRELARKGSIELMDLNKTFKSNGQPNISMNADQLIAFFMWLEARGLTR